jgi:hypothetical protein
MMRHDSDHEQENATVQLSIHQQEESLRYFPSLHIPCTFGQPSGVLLETAFTEAIHV